MFGITADGADLDEFFHAGFSRFFNEVYAHNRIFVEEGSGCRLICTDSPTYRCEMDDDIGLGIGKELLAFVGVDKVVVGLFGIKEMQVPFLCHIAEVRAKKAIPSGDDYGFIFQSVAGVKHLRSTFSRRRSASTIMRTSSLKRTRGLHPS